MSRPVILNAQTTPSGDAYGYVCQEVTPVLSIGQITVRLKSSKTDTDIELSDFYNPEDFLAIQQSINNSGTATGECVWTQIPRGTFLPSSPPNVYTVDAGNPDAPPKFMLQRYVQPILTVPPF